MYSPPLGRFLSPDPLTRDPTLMYDNNWYGDQLTLMRNQYGYCDNNPVNRTDPSGLVPNPIPLYAIQNAINQFNAWYQAEMQNQGWLAALPDCPCNIKYGPVNCWYGAPDQWQSPDPSKWALSDPLGYHPGATMCLRSVNATATGAGQQCCYDSSGALITHGPGAGTPDKVAPGFPYLGHYQADVAPYDLAKWIDTVGAQYGYGGFVNKYLNARPPNKGKGCATNP